MSIIHKPHIKAAHELWSTIVQLGDIVVDATCGNGHDSLYLAKLTLSENAGTLFCLDLQSVAIEQTLKLLQTHLSDKIFARIKMIQGCHSDFPSEIIKETVKLIVYNLGYLPGGNKACTTLLKTTLVSLAKAMQLVQPKGYISITCYPGHSEGKIEEDAILEYVSSLDSKHWNCSHLRWINRLNSPSLLVMQKLEGGKT